MAKATDVSCGALRKEHGSNRGLRRLQHPREHQNVDPFGTAAQQRACGSIRSRPRCHHIVYEHYFPALNALGHTLGNSKRSLQINGSLRARKADLARRRLDPREDEWVGGHTALNRDSLRQGIGLIEPARGEAIPVQGDGHEQFRIHQKFGSGPGHPAPKRFGELHPVIIFEPVYQLPHRPVVELRDRPGAGEDAGESSPSPP
jgi:hypothetical protein